MARLRLVALVATLLAACIPCEGDTADRRTLLPVPTDDIPLNSTEGERLLRDCTHYPGVDVLMHLATQRNQAFCSAATAATLLNAMARTVTAPVDVEFAPYPYFTQRSILQDACVRRVPTHEDGTLMSVKFLATHGATLHEWATYLSCFAEVEHVHAEVSTAAAFRDVVKAVFPTTRGAKAEKFVGINFLRTGVGEDGGGHMSPIAAYDETADRVLIADVSRYKYPPVWARLTSVYGAMNTTDDASGKSRGWVVLGPGAGTDEKSPPPPPPPPSEPFEADEYVASRARCMDAVADDDDWDAVMGCTECPNVFPAGNAHGNGSCDGSRRGAAAAETAAAAFASAAIGAGVVGGWWWREERRRASGFRRHVVLGSEFEDA